MIFYDFEVFEYDWMVVLIDVEKQEVNKIHNDRARLIDYHAVNRDRIWIGFNSRHYDRWILKGIIAGLDPAKINNHIIVKNLPGWKYSGLLNKVHVLNYDVMYSLDRGLKVFEGFMGNNIKESSVDFDIDRPLTHDEVKDVFDYCVYDVEQTIQVFLERQSDFEAHIGLLKSFNLPLAEVNKTKTQLAGVILEATRRTYDDEFDIHFPTTLKLDKYWYVEDWYKNAINRDYKKSYIVRVGQMDVTFAWGGLHGAIPKYTGEGYFVNMDVASLYPNLMIQYNLLSRSVRDPQKFENIVKTRLEYKAQKNPLQAPLKLVINSTYGAMKDKYNPLYDPRQANNVCVHGQLFLLDLMEKLEPHCTLIQANTDGVLIKLDRAEDYSLIDDICYEWETRTGLELEFDEYAKVYQKDVNNYVIIDHEGNYKSKGSWVKKQHNLDYEMAVVNQALIQYMINGTRPEVTINSCNELRDFQQVKKISRLYDYLSHNNTILRERTVRVFASSDPNDGGLFMKHHTKTKLDKVANTPEKCFLINGSLEELEIPQILDRSWYVELAYQRLRDFGLNV